MIQYKKGYKYQLAKEYNKIIHLPDKVHINTDYIMIIDREHHHDLYIDAGYAWDGPSGPTFDTKNFMEPSLVHDALYQLMREEQLPKSYRELADKLLQKMCIECGMSKIRAWWVYVGVRYGAKFAADPKNRKEVITA